MFLKKNNVCFSTLRVRYFRILDDTRSVVCTQKRSLYNFVGRSIMFTFTMSNDTYERK